MTLGTWYQLLLSGAVPSGKQFVRGVATGAGIPTSREQIKQLASQTLGTIFGIPSAYDKIAQGMEETGQALSHPLETARSLADAAKQNPAMAAGVLAGMAIPLRGPRGIPASEFLPRKGRRLILPLETKAGLHFGGQQLAKAKRRITGRVTRERARVHASLEGLTTREQFDMAKKVAQRELRKLGYEPNRGSWTHDFVLDEELVRLGIPLDRAKSYQAARDRMSKLVREPGGMGTINVDPLGESPGDYAQMVKNYRRSDITTDFLLDHAGQIEKVIGSSPHTRAMREAAQLRGPTPDDLHTQLEGPPGRLPRRMLRTREEIGGEMLQAEGIKVPTTRSEAQLYAQSMSAPEAMGSMATPKLGEIVAQGGKRWQLGTRGWQLLPGKPLAKDFDWVFRKHFDREPPPMYYNAEPVDIHGSLQEMDIPDPSPLRGANIERAVEEIQGHGMLTSRLARTMVAKRISDRMKIGKAASQEIVWFNLHRSKMFGKGGVGWHQ